MAGVGNDIDQRRLIILLGNGSMVHTLGHQVPGLDGAQVQAHSQAHTLTGNGPLQEHTFPVQRLIAGDDDIGQLVGALIAVAGVGHPGHFGENIFTNIGNQRRDTSHSGYLQFIILFNIIT